MSNRSNKSYQKGFLPYALAAFLIGLIGGLSTILGPAFFSLLICVPSFGH